MPELDKIDRKPPRSLINRMSLYASSADYESRLSEDCNPALEPDAVDEAPTDEE